MPRPPFSTPRTGELRRLRRHGWLGALQLAVFMCSMLLPMPSAHSDYFGDLDNDGIPEQHADDDGQDTDNDGLKDGFEIYVSGTDPLNWDSNSDGYADGDAYHQFYGVNYWYSTAMNVQGTVTFADFDGDGTPNWQDSLPVDGLNGMGDRDSDGIWDMFDAYPDDYYNGDPWMGQPHFNYNGTEYYGSWMDTDTDGIPDAADSYPYDYNNGIPPGPPLTSSFSGNYWINGADTYLSGSYNSGESDSDYDGIPDSFDPYPWDYTNNTSWWGGGQYDVDGVSTSLSGGYYSSSLSDSDSDGVLDLFDPYPNDATNNTSWWNGQSFAGSWNDQDSDGIPDALDPYPADFWNGDFWMGQPHFSYNGTEYAGSWSDSDSDGIPDAADSYPDDYYNGTMSDSDYDGIPDIIDPYPYDSTNGGSSPIYSSWSGNAWINGVYTSLSGTYSSSDPNPTNDSDGDGIWDMFDPYPYDFTNNTSWWDGGQYDVDGVSTSLSGGYYSTWLPNYTGMSLPDTDNDGLLDVFDPYASDATNNTSYWNGQYYVDGTNTYLSGAYSSSVALTDSDSDGIFDLFDPYTSDATNNTSIIGGQYYAGHPFDGSHPLATTAWLADWFAHPENRTAAPLYLSLTNLADTDGDSIPDEMEDFFGLNKQDVTDAFMIKEGSAYTNLERYLGWQDLRDPFDPWQYGQADSIPNMWKVRYGFNLQDPGLFLQDTDTDGLDNLSEYGQGTNPLLADTDEDGESDGTEVAQGSSPTDAASNAASIGSGGSGTGGAGGSGGGTVGGNNTTAPVTTPPPVEPKFVIYARSKTAWAAIIGFPMFDESVVSSGMPRRYFRKKTETRYTEYSYSEHRTNSDIYSSSTINRAASLIETSYNVQEYPFGIVSTSHNASEEDNLDSFDILTHADGMNGHLEQYLETINSYGANSERNVDTEDRVATSSLDSPSMTHIHSTSLGPQPSDNFVYDIDVPYYSLGWPFLWFDVPKVESLFEVTFSTRRSRNVYEIKNISEIEGGNYSFKSSTHDSIEVLTDEISPEEVTIQLASDLQSLPWATEFALTTSGVRSEFYRDPMTSTQQEADAEYYVALVWPEGTIVTPEQQATSRTVFWEEKYRSLDGSVVRTEVRTATLKPGEKSEKFTLSAIAENSMKSGWKTVGSLTPIDIEEVISDQIAGNEANKLPTAFYKGEPNNPILMATRSGVSARLMVRMNVQASVASKVIVGARKVGTTTVLGSTASIASPGKTPLSFDAYAGHHIYEVVAGYDANFNNTLENSEVVVVFQKTPKTNSMGGVVSTGLGNLDKVIIVTESGFNLGKFEAIGNNVWGTDYSGDLISAFAHGSTVVPEATTTSPHTIISKQPKLSHSVGAKWDPTLSAQTHRISFYDGSEASEDVKSSYALPQVLESAISANLAAIKSASSSSWTVSGPYTFSAEINFEDTEDEWIGINELHYAFGKVTWTGTIQVSSRWVAGGKIEVGSVTYSGQFDDVYDFTYWGGEKAQEASLAQAGHATLASAPEPNSGKVFYTRVVFNGTKSIGKEF